MGIGEMSGPTPGRFIRFLTSEPQQSCNTGTAKAAGGGQPAEGSPARGSHVTQEVPGPKVHHSLHRSKQNPEGPTPAFSFTQRLGSSFKLSYRNACPPSLPIRNPTSHPEISTRHISSRPEVPLSLGRGGLFGVFLQGASLASGTHIISLSSPNNRERQALSALLHSGWFWLSQVL